MAKAVKKHNNKRQNSKTTNVTNKDSKHVVNSKSDMQKWKNTSSAKGQGKDFSKPNQRKKYSKFGKRKGKDEEEEGFEEVSGTLEESMQRITVVAEEAAAESDSGDELRDTRKMVQKQNRKKKKSGAFQSMGLSHNVFKGITRKGYNIPTPIQRKTIPLIMDGKDVVAMARTGSGKTAAFLIPMFEHLKTHATHGARALLLSPTRELALQTLKFTKELGKYTGLRAAVILGGDSMEEQFAALHENPDIIIATPGRFMHVMVEMELKLTSVEYVVFDEADRLFEMGFQEQLTEILNRLPESRQTLLFSATLPKLLVEFARAGLHDPTLIRLDVDTKLSENLQLAFLNCRSEDKTAVLLHLLRAVVKPSEQTVVFVATKYHVEYLAMIMKEAGINCSYSYSDLDPTARKINVAKFRNKTTKVLVVTDLAARGIDIPMLDVVINYNFPAKSKLFLHRVGRVARAGSSGIAYSLLSQDELPYVLDLHMFLGRQLKMAHDLEMKKGAEDTDGMLGQVPQHLIDDEFENLQLWNSKTDVEGQLRVTVNAMKNYIKSRPSPSSESVKRIKEMMATPLQIHPIFKGDDSSQLEEKQAFLQSMRKYKPSTTIFEVNKTSANTAHTMMQKQRLRHERVIDRHHMLQEERQKQSLQKSAEVKTTQAMSTDADQQEAFSRVVAPKRWSNFEVFEPKKKKPRKSEIDEENYLHYRPKDYLSEKGLSLGTSFEKEATNAVLDINGDDDRINKKMGGAVKWDRKKKKFVGVNAGKDGNQKRVKTESGAWVKASFKTNIYKTWLERSKTKEQDSDDEDSASRGKQNQQRPKEGRLQVFGGGTRQGKGYHSMKMNTGFEKGKKPKGRLQGLGLKRKENILKERRQQAKKASFTKFSASKKKGNFKKR